MDNEIVPFEPSEDTQRSYLDLVDYCRLTIAESLGVPDQLILYAQQHGNNRNTSVKRLQDNMGGVD